MALSTVFHSINSPDNSLLSRPVLPVLFLPYWSFHYIHLGLVCMTEVASSCAIHQTQILGFLTMKYKCNSMNAADVRET